MRAALRLLLLLATLSLGACGFHLRGHQLNQTEFPFQSVHLKTAGETQFVADLRYYLTLNKLEVQADPGMANVTLEVVAEKSDKQILSLSGAGRVREFQLRYAVTLRAYDAKGREWLPAEEIAVARTLTYDDAQVLAKEQEEILLYRDMRIDAVQQVLRRLSHARPMDNSP